MRLMSLQQMRAKGQTKRRLESLSLGNNRKIEIAPQLDTTHIATHVATIFAIHLRYLEVLYCSIVFDRWLSLSDRIVHIHP